MLRCEPHGPEPWEGQSRASAGSGALPPCLVLQPPPRRHGGSRPGARHRTERAALSSGCSGGTYGTR